MLKPFTVAAGGLLLLLGGCGEGADEDNDLGFTSSGLELASNDRGFAETFHTAGTIDRTNPFFTANGPPTNLRSCETCHLSDQGWTITPDATTDLFNQSSGLAPLFFKFDEGNRPDADLSTLAKRKKAFGNTLLAHGVTRFPGTEDTPEFTAIAVKDPNGFSTVPPAPSPNAVIFRRPSPTANEALVAQTNWAFIPSDFAGPGADVPAFLVPNAIGATGFHEHDPTPLPGLIGLNPGEFPPINPAGPPLDPAKAVAIKDFLLGLFFAQTFDNAAGALDTGGAHGGPAFLASLTSSFHVGINDIQGLDPSGAAFNRKVFNIFDAWADADADHSLKGKAKKQAQARASIYRGQEIFNFHEFNISGVNGLNDLLGKVVVRGTCSTCHNVPNVGGHSQIRVFDTGTANKGHCLSSDYPLVTYKNKTTGETRQVCDAGRGGVSGRWVDLGAFRAPPLRGLAARSPYFHDGQGKQIEDVIKFYNNRFGAGINGQAATDLANFLEAL